MPRTSNSTPRLRAPTLVRPLHVVLVEVNGGWVETTQIAPTILKLLGLDPSALQAVRLEGTQALPVIDRANADR